MYKSRTLSNVVVAMLVLICPSTTTNAFQTPTTTTTTTTTTSRPGNNVFTQKLPVPQHRHSTSTALPVVADPPMEKEDEKRKKGNNNNNNKAWIERDGGFVPNLRGRILRRNSPTTAPLEVTDMYQYKEEVVDVQDQIVCVRFYAPWCRACKAVEGKFRRLSRDFPNVKFVEVPVTKENARLHQALQVPSLPFAHIYEPSVGLVVERKINKNVFGEFKKVLNTYVQGECEVDYDDNGEPVSA